MADEIGAPAASLAGVETDPDPQRQTGGLGLGVEALLEGQPRAHGGDGVGEEEEQAVTELLHDPGVFRQRLRHHAVLRGEEGERGLVARRGP